MIALTMAVVVMAAISYAAGPNLPYTGVNLAGAEFRPTPTPGNLGTYGSQYSYPTNAEVD